MTRLRRGLAAAALAVSVLGAGAPAPLGEASTAPRDDEFYLSVDLSARTLSVVRNGETVNSYPVAIGQPAHPTPTGEYRIRHIVWNPRWVPPDARWARGKRPRDPGDPRNPMGRVKMFFRDPDLYVHGTRETDSLGEAESHGCVRMSNSTVIAVARQVMEHGGEPRPAGWFRRVLDSVTATRQVYLSRPVLIKIHR
ncbi:L,D-transpeptidase [Longimicrobium sp.]|uniref:L,D-transpeptidase n=1 Tax=Longimicrobium sp. TaxID=2029185 RepID=UPI002C74A6EE|nr:L,D-transpeptidase [Longimicrobium sp.]HSU12735.1 L,D-transpeptidase [Longimicrobium sp.]